MTAAPVELGQSARANGVIKGFFGSLKWEALYRLEIRDVVELAAEAVAYQRLYNEVRPHEALDFATPLSRYLATPDEPHLSEATIPSATSSPPRRRRRSPRSAAERADQRSS